MPGRNYTDLSSLHVRPINPGEKSKWNHLVETYHYLHSRRLVGESIRYVASLNNEWVALLGWNTGAFRLTARDSWIGWSDKHRIERFKYTVNNSRFLILPGVEIKNLASKTLALNMKRLSSDWLRAYDHNVVLAETFVDPAIYEGTCYKAAGFICVGRTKGYGISAGNYYYHGQKKLIFLRPLYQEAQQWLKAPFLAPTLLVGQEREPLLDLNRMELYGEDGLLGYLRNVPDWRDPSGRRHELAIVLSLIAWSTLAGIEGKFAHIAQWVKELPWAVKKKMGCRRYYGSPSEPTIRRTIRTVDIEEFCTQTANWLCKHGKEQIVEEVSRRLRLLSKRRISSKAQTGAELS